MSENVLQSSRTGDSFHKDSKKAISLYKNCISD